MRDAQLKIARRRPGGAVGATPTPAGVTPTRFPGATPRGIDALDSTTEAGADVPNVSLDAFLANHTSEDNSSFRAILDQTNKRRRERAAMLLAPPDPTQMITDGRELTDGFGTTGQPTDTVLAWRHRPVNLLMYSGGTQDSLPLSKKEQEARAQGPPAGINHRATRLRPAGDVGAASASPSTSVDTQSTTHSGASMAQDAGRRSGKGPQGYDILATPSFDPGVDASPLVTWGDIEATPVRIDEEDLPPGGLGPGGAGPPGGSSFRIQDTPRREVKAHELALKASASMRKRPRGSSLAEQAALAALGRTPRSGASGNSTPLSSAARRLASSMQRGRSKTGGADLALRASYRGTPARQAGGGWEESTPGRSSSRWSPSATLRGAQ